MSDLKIDLNRKKLRKLLIVSSAFLMFSVFLLFQPQSVGLISNTLVIRVFAVMILCFSTLGLIYALRKSTNKNLGLFIDEQGITDNSSAYHFGLMEWQDIQNISLSENSKQPLILIEARDYDKYLNRIDSPVFRKAAAQNQILYGTPLIIWCSLLDVSPAKLETILKHELKNRK